MPATGLTLFDRTLNDTNSWLKAIGQELGEDDRKTAFHALRGTLFALRDRLEVDETFDLAAQLPTLVRGVFFEGYKPAGKPLSYRDKGPFLEQVSAELDAVPISVPPEDATRAVLTTLSAHVTDGVVEHVYQMLPEDVRALWPSQAEA